MICVKWGKRLASQQQDDSSSHGDARLLYFIITAAVCALHPHGGHAQADRGQEDTDDHQSTSSLKSTYTHTQTIKVLALVLVQKPNTMSCFPDTPHFNNSH